MASTHTNTSTKTETFTRILGIQSQFKIAFKRIMDYTDEKCQPYLDAIKAKKINFISFWAYKFDDFGEKEKWCELTLYVDWEKHERFTLEGNNEISLKRVWNGIIPDISVAVEMIEECISEFELIPTFSINFVKNISEDEYKHYMKILGLVSCKKVQWKNNKNKAIYASTPKELPELSAEVYVLSEDI